MATVPNVPNVGDWIAQKSDTIGRGDINLSSSLLGFGTFQEAGGTRFFYSLQEGDNKETGICTLVGRDTLTRDTIYTTYYNGVYDSAPTEPIPLAGGAIVYSSVSSQIYTDLVIAQQKLDSIEHGATMDQDAIEVPYDPSVSGLVANNVQEALDEIEHQRVNGIDFSKYLTITNHAQTVDGHKTFTNPIIINTESSAANAASTVGQLTIVHDNLEAEIQGKASSKHTHDASDIISGVFDGDRLPVGSTTDKGIVLLSSALDSASETEAATPKAVKEVSDKADAAKLRSDDSNALQGHAANEFYKGLSKTIEFTSLIDPADKTVDVSKEPIGWGISKSTISKGAYFNLGGGTGTSLGSLLFAANYDTNIYAISFTDADPIKKTVRKLYDSVHNTIVDAINDDSSDHIASAKALSTTYNLAHSSNVTGTAAYALAQSAVAKADGAVMKADHQTWKDAKPIGSVTTEIDLHHNWDIGKYYCTYKTAKWLNLPQGCSPAFTLDVSSVNANLPDSPVKIYEITSYEDGRKWTCSYGSDWSDWEEIITRSEIQDIGKTVLTETIFTDYDSWGKPFGRTCLVKPSSIGLPTSQYTYWTRLGIKDNSNGYSGILTEVESGKSWIGYSHDASGAPKFCEIAFVDNMYPIGSVYTTTKTDNPSVLLGFGTWVSVNGASTTSLHYWERTD